MTKNSFGGDNNSDLDALVSSFITERARFELCMVTKLKIMLSVFSSFEHLGIVEQLYEVFLSC